MMSRSLVVCVGDFFVRSQLERGTLFTNLGNVRLLLEHRLDYLAGFMLTEYKPSNPPGNDPSTLLRKKNPSRVEANTMT